MEIDQTHSNSQSFNHSIVQSFNQIKVSQKALNRELGRRQFSTGGDLIASLVASCVLRLVFAADWAFSASSLVISSTAALVVGPVNEKVK